MKKDYGRFIVCALLLVAASAARAQDFGAPLLLVAAPGVQGAYSGTVVVALPVSGGHAGVILNRSRDVKRGELLPASAHAAKVASPVRFGGPLGSKVVLAMVRRDPGEGAKRLVNDVYLTTGSETIERVVEHMPGEARFYAGMIVWLPEELEAQIEAGEWLVTHPDSATLFHPRPEAMWGELAARVGEKRGSTKTALK
jgi:putative AlgH/UPF0301 family transcriptional regulator